jgi:undecaprenyl-diphosphatase
VPVSVAGVAAKNIIENELHAPLPVALALIAGGVVLILIERLAARGDIERAEHVPLTTALSIGVFQCLALVPGTSRSGATIVGGRLLGLSRRAAAEFSFFLAIPTMTAACGYKLLKDYKDINWHQGGLTILVGCVCSFVTAWAVVAVFMRLIERSNALAFWGWYRLVLGALVLYALC